MPDLSDPTDKLMSKNRDDDLLAILEEEDHESPRVSRRPV